MRGLQEHDFVGYYELGSSNQNISLSLPLCKSKISFAQGHLLSNKPIFETNYYFVLLTGKISMLYSKAFSLNMYENRQEKLVLDLYKKYGDDFQKLIDGSFFILIYDKNKKTLNFFNNRYCATNMYYYLDEKIFFFASDLKLLLKNLPFKPKFDMNSVPSFLSTGFSFNEKMQFKNINRLLPTFRITCVSGKILFHNNWKSEFKFQRKPFNNLDKHLDKYEDLFQQSIKSYLDAVKPKQLGCFLSGGHDTSFVFLHASKIFQKPIHSFTAYFEKSGFDECPKAEYITKKFGGKHHRVLVKSQHLDYVPEMVRNIEEPVSGSSLPVYVIAKQASKYVDTALTGDSGDTLWNEYHPLAEWHKYFRHLPFFARKSLHKFSQALLKFNGWERFWEMEHALGLFAKKNFYQDFFANLCTYRQFKQDDISGLLNKKVYESTKMNKCMLDIPFNSRNFQDMLIEAKMFYGVYMYMNLSTQKALESQGVRFVAPYLNHKLIEFITSLPHEWQNHGSSFKLIFNDAIKRRFHKQALLRHLPKKYVYSSQQSLDVPYRLFFNERPDILKNLLFRLKKRGWYNESVLNKLFLEIQKFKAKPHEIFELKDHSYRVYSLLTFEVWCMEFLDRFNQKNKKKPARSHTPLEDYLAWS